MLQYFNDLAGNFKVWYTFLKSVTEIKSYSEAPRI